jgi:hypothetical protein
MNDWLADENDDDNEGAVELARERRTRAVRLHAVGFAAGYHTSSHATDASSTAASASASACARLDAFRAGMRLGRCVGMTSGVLSAASKSKGSGPCILSNAALAVAELHAPLVACLRRDGIGDGSCETCADDEAVMAASEAVFSAASFISRGGIGSGNRG